MSLGVTYRTIWDVLRTLHWDGRPQDVVFQRPEDVGKGRPQGVGMGRPLVLHRGPYGTFIGRLFVTFLRRPQNVILPSGM